MGYPYVLLDKSVWQAYEVTTAGCMRQFNPYEMPKGDRSLASVATLRSGEIRFIGHSIALRIIFQRG